MRKLPVFRLREVTLPAAWLVWAAGFVPGALGSDNAGNINMFQAAVIVGLLLAAAAWLGRNQLDAMETSWVHSSLLVLLVLASALGMILGSAEPGMLMAVLLGLGWWDLADFTRRLKQFGRGEASEVDLLVSSHLRRLALALGLGLVAGVLALSASVRLKLEGAMVLGALAVLLIRVGIGRAWRS